MNKAGYKTQSTPNIFLVGLRMPNMSRRMANVSLEELERLIDTSGGNVVGKAFQEIKRINPATLVGEGKVAQIKEEASALNADMIAIDGDLTPVQNRNIEAATGLFVIDRPAVILDIFAKRAHSKEGKLQVELAQLNYLAPRLVGRGHMLSQQAGRIGTRGPGETQLEYDRRRIRGRITSLKKSLEDVRKHRKLHRERREDVPLPIASLVGYTNAGKSSLLNALTDARAFVEDKLFATLDPTVRRLKLPSGRDLLLVDTVGFIRRLPHQLIEAFHATLEETEAADLLLIVVDGSDPESQHQFEVVENVLCDLHLNDKPQIIITNKSDLSDVYFHNSESISLSATKRTGLDDLLQKIDDVLASQLTSITLLIPHDKGAIASELYRIGYVSQSEHRDDGILLSCALPKKQLSKYIEYRIKPR